MNKTGRVQKLHPKPLVLMLQRDAIIPIIRNLHAVDDGPIDRKDKLRLHCIAIAERREAIHVFDIREQAAGVGVEVRHECEGVVVDDFIRGVRQSFEGGFEGGVCGVDDGAEGVPLRGGVDAEPVGPERCEVLGVQVCDEDIRGSCVEQGGYQVGDLGGYVAGEFVVEGWSVDAEGSMIGRIHVVGTDPQEMEGVFVDAAFDVVVDLHFATWGTPARFAELAGVKPWPVREACAEVGLLHRVVDGCAEMTPSPSMPESEILVHRHAEEVGKIGHGYRAIGPGAEAVDLVSVNHVCRSFRCDIVGVAAVPVI